MSSSTSALRVGSPAALLLALSALPLATQEPSGALVDSYRRAAEIVRRGVEAHGGLAAVRGLRSIDFTWEGLSYGRYGGRDPGVLRDSAPPAQPVRVRTAADLERGRWLSELEMTSPGGLRGANRWVLDGREVLTYDAIGRAGGAGGTGYARDSVPPGAPAPVPFTVNLMPVLLLRQAVAREATLRHLGTATALGRREHVVSFANPDGSLTTLWFDSATHRLAGVEALATHPLLGDLNPTWRFSDYQMVDGLLVPHAFEHHANGLLEVRQRLKGVTVNSALPDSLFDPPAGYVRRPAGGAPAVVDAGGGVYFVEPLAGARAMFVDTDEGIVAFEAPGSPALVEQALALLERALPGRPVRYVVLTHHHTENFGGLGAYVNRGATILVPPGVEPFLRRLLAAPRAFGSWTRGEGAPAKAALIETVRGRRRIGAGAGAVALIDAGPTSHALGMLVGYVPARRLLIQSDLLRVNDHGGPALAPQAAADLAQIIRRHRLDVETIAALRGANATPADLRAAAAASDGRR